MLLQRKGSFNSLVVTYFNNVFFLDRGISGGLSSFIKWASMGSARGDLITAAQAPRKKIL